MNKLITILLTALLCLGAWAQDHGYNFSPVHELPLADNLWTWEAPRENASAELTGEYLGQTPPGMSVEMFAPDIISKADNFELNSVFSPKGDEFIFTRGPSINKDKGEFCPMVSPDGKYFFFTAKNNNKGDIYWVSTDYLETLRSATGIAAPHK
jgi:hypothetical protein